eukprot:TRINITY_DN3355_c0_g1_i11.p1 TRINITY_DN3355_c0_g1~~TRINITY_DN3355_c0_g1_i11.p1  ORF type:complete len:283 (-),score=17.85 TRINITY_DN3355_c0_g1_i11:488-1336(-)
MVCTPKRFTYRIRSLWRGATPQATQGQGVVTIDIQLVYAVMAKKPDQWACLHVVVSDNDKDGDPAEPEHPDASEDKEDESPIGSAIAGKLCPRASFGTTPQESSCTLMQYNVISLCGKCVTAGPVCMKNYDSFQHRLRTLGLSSRVTPVGPINSLGKCSAGWLLIGDAACNKPRDLRICLCDKQPPIRTQDAKDGVLGKAALACEADDDNEDPEEEEEGEECEEAEDEAEEGEDDDDDDEPMHCVICNKTFDNGGALFSHYDAKHREATSLVQCVPVVCPSG